MLEATDMSRGVYRRLYSALLHGRRINAVSDTAELLFCRLLLLADDFGNLNGDPKLIKATGFPRRSWSIRKIEDALGELFKSATSTSPSLITKYTVGGETYINITGFEEMQPKGRNGRRIRRCPAIQVNPGESKTIPCVQAHHYHYQDQDHSEDHSDSTERRKPPATEAEAAQGKTLTWNPGDGWAGITETDRQGWRVAYPAVDLDIEIARAGEWLRSNPAKAPRSNYRRFLTGWLSRTQDRGGSHGFNGRAPPATSHLDAPGSGGLSSAEILARMEKTR